MLFMKLFFIAIKNKNKFVDETGDETIENLNVNSNSSNSQWVNSLADMFRDLSLSSVPDIISNLDITN